MAEMICMGSAELGTCCGKCAKCKKQKKKAGDKAEKPADETGK